MKTDLKKEIPWCLACCCIETTIMTGIYHPQSSRRYIYAVFLIGTPLFLFSVYLSEWGNFMTTSDFSRFSIVLKTKLRKVDEEREKKVNDAMLLASASCLWKPYSNSDCMDILSKHLSISLNASRRIFLSQFSKENHSAHQQDCTTQSVHLHRRWLFLGDSAIIRSFGPLHHYLVNETVQRYTRYRSSMTAKSSCYDYYTSNSSSSSVYRYLNCSYITTNRCDKMDKLQLKPLPVSSSIS